MTTPHPREALTLFGRDSAEATLYEAWNSGRMPHAWLISGERGTGKATLAYRFATHVLGGSLEADDPVRRRIVAGSHGDLLTIEPGFDEKKDEAKREISVEQARSIAAFLSMTSAEGGWRVAIVDSVDELNANAANAILKTVEEPPPRALLLLISHNPGRLLPTIRSRCRALKAPPLSSQAFQQVMRYHAPDCDMETLETLEVLSHYSPGAALELQALEGAALYAKFIRLFETLPRLEPGNIIACAEAVMGEKSHARWRIASGLLLRLLAIGAGVATPQADERRVQAVMQSLWPKHDCASRYAQASEQFSLAARAHLDYKTVLTTFFHSLTQPINLWNRSLST